MGGGGFDYDTSLSRGISYQTKSREEVFAQRAMHRDMDV